MKQRLAFLVFILVTVAVSSARAVSPAPLSRRVVEYLLDARLELDAARHPSLVKGHEFVTWWNDSSDTVTELQFHLYLNAFKNQKSTFFRESGGQLRGDQFEAGSWGAIDITSMKTSGNEDLQPKIQYIHPDDDNADDQTVIRVPLTKPVRGGEKITLDISFTSKLPRVFARSGYWEQFALVGQWFPKLGVWEKAGDRGVAKSGWNCHQYHALSEFYADFGFYDFRLTVPANLIVGATGKEEGGGVLNPDGTKTHHFMQADVHDFAWTVSPEFIRVARQFKASEQVTEREIAQAMELLSLPRESVELKDVEVILLIQPEHRSQIERHVRAAFNAIKYFGLWYGRYPYDTLTIVDPPYNADGAGGMEYPTFITAGTTWWPGHELNTEEVIVHEFGHQYWYGMVASNEFEEPWLDEGFVTYSTSKVLETAYGADAIRLPGFGIPLLYAPVRIPHPLADREALAQPFADPILTEAWKFYNERSYGESSYPRSSLTLATLENYLGGDTMARVMREYFQRFKFKHPATTDFQTVVSRAAARDMTWFFDQFVRGVATLDYSVDEVKSEREKGKRGLYDQDGKRSEVTEEQAREEESYATTIAVRRLGEAYFPVELRAVFEDGSVINDQSDGRARWQRFKYKTRSRLKYATIDPDNKVLLDVNIVNNAKVLERFGGGAWRWGTALHYWAEVFFQFLVSLM